jgi:hypothetical protein
MYARLKQIAPQDLFLLAATGARALRAGVEAELDRRAAAALVRRILEGSDAPHRRPEGRRSGKELVTA